MKTRAKRKAQGTMMDKNKTTVTFHVFRKDGSKNPDIKNFFLENVQLDAHMASEGTITLEDKTVWTIVLEEPVAEALKQQAGSISCLVSFQARVQGNFAVCRLFDPNKRKQKARQ